jgi:hypothetical protein
MPADMHIIGWWIGAQQMVMNGCNDNAARHHLLHDRVDLVFKQDEIAHHHGLAFHLIERDPAGKGERRLDRHAVDGDVEVGARKGVESLSFALNRRSLLPTSERFK